MRCGRRGALIKNEKDVRTKPVLDFDGAFRRKAMKRTVEMRSKRHAFIIDDRPTVCDMFRSCGMRVFQVAVGTEY